MKIFLSFFQGKPGHPIPAYGFWEYYIKQGIAESGHEWIECKDVDWAYGLVAQSSTSFSQWKTAAWEKTVRYLRSHPADLFLAYLYPSQVDAAAIAEIRKMGIPCVNFFCDNVRTFRRIPEEYRAFDLNWVPESNATGLYRKAGMPFVHLPMPMWVAPEHRVLKEEKLEQVSFIGSTDIQRIILLEDILSRAPELPLAIYGEGWLNSTSPAAPETPVPLKFGLSQWATHQNEFIRSQGLTAWFRKIRYRKNNTVPSARLRTYLRSKPDFQEYVRLSQESRITMGINRYPSFRFPLNQPDSYSRLRDIEAPMLGCCYLTEWANGLDELYDIGNEIFVYRSPADFIEQYTRLASDEVLRRKLRKKGQLRSLNEHSIPHTLNAIFKTLN